MSDRFGFDPYSPTTFPVSRLASFYGGRCLSRIYWHLQQGFLLSSNLDPQTRAEQIRRDKAAHLANGFRVVDTLSTLVAQLEDGAADRVSRNVRRYAADWKESLEPDLFRELIDSTTEEFREQPEEASPAPYCAELVRQHVDPLYDQLDRAMAGLPHPHAVIFQLGVQCERGICRPDVCRFLDWSGNWPVLDEVPPVSAPDTPVPEEEDIQGNVGASLDDEPAARTLATRCFVPGQLAPDDGWIDDLLAAWMRAGLPYDTVSTKLSVLRRQLGHRTLQRDGLIQAVDEIHRTACEQICDRAPTIERVQVDVATNRITVDGSNYDVEPHHAQIVATMRRVAMDGTWWLTDKEIADLPGCKGKNLPREFRTLFLAVPELEALIVGKKGTGRRFK